jgi:hypothetical protein
MREYGIPRNIVAKKLGQAELAIVVNFQKPHRIFGTLGKEIDKRRDEHLISR